MQSWHHHKSSTIYSTVVEGTVKPAYEKWSQLKGLLLLNWAVPGGVSTVSGCPFSVKSHTHKQTFPHPDCGAEFCSLHSNGTWNKRIHVLSSKSFSHISKFTSTLKKQQQKRQKMHDCTRFATMKQPYPHSVPVTSGSLATGGPSHQDTSTAAPQTKQEWKSLQGPERYQQFGVNAFGTVNGTLTSCLKNQHKSEIY